jgi:hypothetical protein
MDADTLQPAAGHAGVAVLGAGFLAGLIFSFNPVALASIPMSLAYVTKARTAQQSLQFGAAYTVGMITIRVLLAFAPGSAAAGRRVWLITVDPKRDAPQSMKDYLTSFDRTFAVPPAMRRRSPRSPGPPASATRKCRSKATTAP